MKTDTIDFVIETAVIGVQAILGTLAVLLVLGVAMGLLWGVVRGVARLGGER